MVKKQPYQANPPRSGKRLFRLSVWFKMEIDRKQYPDSLILTEAFDLNFEAGTLAEAVAAAQAWAKRRGLKIDKIYQWSPEQRLGELPAELLKDL